MQRSRSANAYAFLAFPLAVLLLFSLLPTILGLGLAFFRWDGGGAPAFVGLANFRALVGDHRFGPAVLNTIVYVVASVPPSVVLAFLLAVAVHARWFRGKALVRTLLFLPTIVSIVAIGFVWRWMLDDQAGLLQWALGLVGIADPPDWLNEGRWPLVAIVVVTIWRNIGFCLVFYLAALANVDETLYEAADLDGASSWATLRHVTWPQVAPTTIFLLVTGVISALQVFDIVYVMSSRQVGPGVTVLNYEVYSHFRNGQLGYAAALGVVIFLLTLAVTAGQLRLLRPRPLPAGARRAAA